jgi:hypothetical protein
VVCGEILGKPLQTMTKSNDLRWQIKGFHGNRGAPCDLLVRAQALPRLEWFPKRYADELRRKRDVFREVTKTRKTLFLTMLTAFGVRDNEDRRELIDHSILTKSLFS